jgi:hypothetical protein
MQGVELVTNGVVLCSCSCGRMQICAYISLCQDNKGHLNVTFGITPGSVLLVLFAAMVF